MNTPVQRILLQLRQESSDKNRFGMARFGINVQHVLGLPPARLRDIAKAIGRDHALALDLRTTRVHEARMLAAYLADPAQLTSAQMDQWISEVDSWDLCDGFAIHLFRKSPLAWKKAMAWSRRKAEFTRRAGFALMAALAVHDKQASNEKFLACFRCIEAASNDSRNFVKKAVNWALRKIGKRNSVLRQQAIQLAHRLSAADTASARWIGRDAFRELE